MKTKQIKGAVEIMLISTTAKVLLNNPHVLLKMVSNMRPDLKNEVDKWDFNCRLSEITEDQKMEILGINFCYLCPLEKKGVYSVNGGFVAGCEGSKCETTRENIDISFDELFEANGVLKENPQGEKPVCDCNGACGEADRYNCGYDNHLWQEAEANVFPPETTLVFIKE